MTIKDYLIEKMYVQEKARLEKLIDIGAPRIMITNMQMVVDDLHLGKLPKINGDRSLLEMEFSACEVKKGNGGRQYIAFDCGVNFFPNAQYGRFISKSK